MKLPHFLFIILLLGYSVVSAQVAINTDGSSTDGSAILGVKSTDRGFLPPRVANISAISNPVAGLQVYDISNQCMRYYNGSYWSDCLGVNSSDGNKNCGGTITDIDGNTYTTVQIGIQCWMAENLNVGTMINGSNNQTDNGTIEKYCYDNNTANCDTYGGLYQWNEVMQYVTTAGTQGICPMGWHLPTDAEWTTLTNYVGGSDVAGGKMKEAGTSHWVSPNTGATNSSGFTGLPGGSRLTTGSFLNIGYKIDFWSSNGYGTSAWIRFLFYDKAEAYRNTNQKATGCSVRCVRN